MCRNIKTLFNFEPPVTEEEVRAASLQFVRKISGFNKPSKTNEVAFSSAVEEIARISKQLLVSLESNAAPKNRQEEAAKAKARAAQRFGGKAQPAAFAGGQESSKFQLALRLAGMTSRQCACSGTFVPGQTFTRERGPESGVPSVAITIARFG